MVSLILMNRRPAWQEIKGAGNIYAGFFWHTIFKAQS